MKPKYEKPTFKDLGAAFPNAIGDCSGGSIPTIPHLCTLGNVYRQGACSPGAVASANCGTGATPKTGAGAADERQP